MWAQSLYLIGKLLHEEFIAPGELDPMNRYRYIIVIFQHSDVRYHFIFSISDEI